MKLLKSRSSSSRARRLAPVVLAVSMFGVGLAGRVEAAPITIDFSGVVDFVDPSLTGTFAPGQTLLGSYTFESTTAARSGSTSQFGVFDAISALNFSIGSYIAGANGAFPNGEIQVDNDPPGTNHDRYGIVSRSTDHLTGPSVGGMTPDAFLFRMDDSTNAVFATALTLPTQISLSDFDSSAFFLFFRGADGFVGSVSGQLTQAASPAPVPEPASLMLLGSGLLGLAARVRRQRRLSA